MAFNSRTRSSGGRGGFGSNRSSRPQPAPRPAQRGPSPAMAAARQAVSQGQMRPSAQSGPNPAMAAARQAAALQQGQRLSNTAMTPQAAMNPAMAAARFSPGNAPGVPDRGSMTNMQMPGFRPPAGGTPGGPSSPAAMPPFKKGGSVKASAKSAGKSRDGIAQRGKTKGRMC